MYYVYVIQSQKDRRFYTGSTNDLRKRFNKHNSGKVFSTKNRGPFKLIYYEACLNEYDTKNRERYLKSGMGKRYLKNRLKRFLSVTGLTLIEIIVASLILSLTMLGMVNLFISGKRYILHTRSRMTAGELNKHFLDPLQMSVRQDEWNNSLSDYIPSNPLSKGTRTGESVIIDNISYTSEYNISVPPTFLDTSPMRKVILNLTWTEPQS